MSTRFPSNLGASGKDVHFAVERKHLKFGLSDAAFLGIIRSGGNLPTTGLGKSPTGPFSYSSQENRSTPLGVPSSSRICACAPAADYPKRALMLPDNPNDALEYRPTRGGSFRQMSDNA